MTDHRIGLFTLYKLDAVMPRGRSGRNHRRAGAASGVADHGAARLLEA
jgi:hypothetical protein